MLEQENTDMNENNLQGIKCTFLQAINILFYFLAQMSHFSNGEISHLGMKPLFSVFIAGNEFGASELHH